MCFKKKIDSNAKEDNGVVEMMPDDVYGLALSEEGRKIRAMSLDSFCNRIAQQMESIRHTDLVSMSGIHGSLHSYYLGRGEEIQLTVLTVSAEHGNFYSMLELAYCYKNEDYPRESEPEYLYWLQRITEDDLVKKYICCMEKGIHMEDLSVESEMYMQFPAGCASYELGLYYRSSEKLEDLRKAVGYLGDSLTCKCPSYPGPCVTVELLKDLDTRINRLELYESNRKVEQQQIDLFRDISIDDLDVNAQVNILNGRLIDKIGEEAWNSFQNETRSCLLTAVSCFYYLLHASDETRNMLDFSCVIVPLMKCIEYELRIRFYNKYIDYLRSKYTPVHFFRINGIENEDNETKKRGKIIIQGRGGFRYSDYVRYPNNYTLGSFSYSVGFLDTYHKTLSAPGCADRTMLDYCRDELFRERNCEEQKIQDWLYNLAINIHDLSDERNTSAHGGSVKTVFSATEALNELVLIEKILIDLVEKCN